MLLDKKTTNRIQKQHESVICPSGCKTTDPVDWMTTAGEIHGKTPWRTIREENPGGHTQHYALCPLLVNYLLNQSNRI